MPKRKQLQEWLAAAKLARIDPAARDRIAMHLAPISAGHLRRLLLESGVPLDPLVEGVRQDSFDQAHRTLCALSEAYAHAPREARAMVIQAKDHARLARRRTAKQEDRLRSEELIEWMIVWVNDPALFPVWVRLRRQVIESRSTLP